MTRALIVGANGMLALDQFDATNDSESPMTGTSTRTAPTPTPPPAFDWPADFDRIPDEDWVDQPVERFGLDYDSVAAHGWYNNLDPAVAQVIAAMEENKLVVDYSGGTGILTRRLLENIDYPVGVLNVDASPKFLRIALERSRDDPRVAFRLLRYIKQEKRLQGLDDVVGSSLLDRGADILTSTNAIHLYYDLPDTLRSWYRVLRPGALTVICSANMHNPNCRQEDWILDDTVARVNEIAADVVRTEPAFEEYREALEDERRMAAYTKLREKVFVPVRPLEYYLDSFNDAGFGVPHVFAATIFARVDEWYDVLRTYHDGVLSWVGGTQKADGRPPSDAAVRDRLFLIRHSLQKLFPGQDSFPCTWTYMTCRRR
jgi:ubiquinone/menaquinone biosynthesis C-methylase UbiE